MSFSHYPLSEPMSQHPAMRNPSEFASQDKPASAQSSPQSAPASSLENLERMDTQSLRLLAGMNIVSDDIRENANLIIRRREVVQQEMQHEKDKEKSIVDAFATLKNSDTTPEQREKAIDHLLSNGGLSDVVRVFRDFGHYASDAQVLDIISMVFEAVENLDEVPDDHAKMFKLVINRALGKHNSPMNVEALLETLCSYLKENCDCLPPALRLAGMRLAVYTQRKTGYRDVPFDTLRDAMMALWETASVNRDLIKKYLPAFMEYVRRILSDGMHIYTVCVDLFDKLYNAYKVLGLLDSDALDLCMKVEEKRAALITQHINASKTFFNKRTGKSTGKKGQKSSADGNGSSTDDDEQVSLDNMPSSPSQAPVQNTTSDSSAAAASSAGNSVLGKRPHVTDGDDGSLQEKPSKVSDNDTIAAASERAKRVAAANPHIKLFKD